MNLYLAGQIGASTVGDLHDAARGVSAWEAFGAITAVLVGLVGTLLWLVRRGDLKVVERAEFALNELVHEIAGFRQDLAMTRETFVRDYCTKLELQSLDRKVEKIRDHCTIRDRERRLVENPENGD